jgi:hypothetical protein
MSAACTPNARRRTRPRAAPDANERDGVGAEREHLAGVGAQLVARVGAVAQHAAAVLAHRRLVNLLRQRGCVQVAHGVAAGAAQRHKVAVSKQLRQDAAEAHMPKALAGVKVAALLLEARLPALGARLVARAGVLRRQ